MEAARAYVNAGELLNEPYVVNNCVYRGHFRVPEETYFFLGDNRAESSDSRSFENPYIAVSSIKAKVANIKK